MNEKYYILIQTENNTATFIDKSNEVLTFFEIFQLDKNVIFFSKIKPELSAPFLVLANNQQAAFKLFKKKFPNLVKRASSNYYEKILSF